MATFQVSSEAEIVEVVRSALDSKRTLEVVGRGTKRGFGRPVECDDVLDLSGLSGIVNYEPDEMIITARAGTPVADIEAALSKHNQRLGFEPADWGPLFGAPANSATIGGMISANCDGSAAVRYGPCRDHLLGFRAVNGFGEAYKGGGKVVKNVTGFDLPKLFCGAMGTLGPLTEVTLRVFPKPETSLVFTVIETSDGGIAVLRKVWRSSLEATGLALVSYRAAQNFPEFRIPADEFADDDDDAPEHKDCAAIIRLDGSKAALAEKRSMLRLLLVGQEATELSDGDTVFRRIDSATSFSETMEDVWLVHLPPSSAPEILRYEPSVWITAWAGGRIFMRGTAGYDGAWQRKAVERLGGNAILMRASEQTRARVAPFAPEGRARAELTRRVKAVFDPLRLFNPGRMWEGV